MSGPKTLCKTWTHPDGWPVMIQAMPAYHDADKLVLGMSIHCPIGIPFAQVELPEEFSCIHNFIDNLTDESMEEVCDYLALSAAAANGIVPEGVEASFTKDGQIVSYIPDEKKAEGAKQLDKILDVVVDKILDQMGLPKPEDAATDDTDGSGSSATPKGYTPGDAILRKLRLNHNN